MDKISRILPGNARVNSVDMTGSQPVRPGVPEFGRNVGISDVKDRVTITAANDGPVNSVYKNPKEMIKAQIAEDVSRRFFAKPERVQEVNEPIDFSVRNASDDDFDSEDIPPTPVPTMTSMAPPPSVVSVKNSEEAFN